MTGDASFEAGLRAGREEAARFLLGIGFASRRRPSPAVLDEMVRLAADDPSMVDQAQSRDHRVEDAFARLSAEFGDWRRP